MYYLTLICHFQARKTASGEERVTRRYRGKEKTVGSSIGPWSRARKTETGRDTDSAGGSVRRDAASETKTWISQCACTESCVRPFQPGFRNAKEVTGSASPQCIRTTLPGKNNISETTKKKIKRKKSLFKYIQRIFLVVLYNVYITMQKTLRDSNNFARKFSANFNPVNFSSVS